MCVVTHEDRYLFISFLCDVPGSFFTGVGAGCHESWAISILCHGANMN